MPTEDHVAHNNPYSPLTRPLKQLPVATTLAPWLRAGTQTHYWKQKCSVQYLAHLVLRRCKTCSMKYVMVSCEDVSASCNTNLNHTNHRIQASHHCLICVYSRTAPCGTSRRFMRLETGASKKRMPMEATDVNVTANHCIQAPHHYLICVRSMTAPCGACRRSIAQIWCLQEEYGWSQSAW